MSGKLMSTATPPHHSGSGNRLTLREDVRRHCAMPPSDASATPWALCLGARHPGNKHDPQSARRNNSRGGQISRWFLLLSEDLSASNYPGAAKTEKGDTRKRDYRHRARTGCGDNG